jgi:hypothetical protein
MNTTNITNILHQRADKKLNDWLNGQLEPITTAVKATPHGTDWKRHEEENPEGWEYAKANGCTAYYAGPLKISAFLHLRQEWRRREVAEFMAKVEATNATESP